MPITGLSFLLFALALPANVSAGVIGGPYTVQVSLSETDGGNTES